MNSTLNPCAKEFIPFQDTSPFVLSPGQAELLAKRALERELLDNINLIPKITQYDGLEQVAQLVYHHQNGNDVYEVLRDGNIFLDTPICSWHFPDMTLQQIITIYFDDDFVLNDPQLETLASTASSTVIHLHPIDHGENDWHSWKQIP